MAKIPRRVSGAANCRPDQVADPESSQDHQGDGDEPHGREREITLSGWLVGTDEYVQRPDTHDAEPRPGDNPDISSRQPEDEADQQGVSEHQGIPNRR